MARGLIRSPDAMPDRVHVKFSYSAKDADVQEWIWKQPLGAVAEMANEYIAAVARGEVMHGHWKHDLVSNVPQKAEPRTTSTPAVPTPQGPAARAAGVLEDASSPPQQGVLGVEAKAEPAEVPSTLVIAEEPVASVDEVRESIAPAVKTAPVQERVETSATPTEQQNSNTSGSAAAPAERIADPIDISNPASAETAGEGKMMRSDVKKIIDQAKAWQKR